MRNGTVKGCAIFLCSHYREYRCCFNYGLRNYQKYKKGERGGE